MGGASKTKGRGWKAISDVTPVQRAFGKKPLVTEARGGVGAAQARRAPRCSPASWTYASLEVLRGLVSVAHPSIRAYLQLRRFPQLVFVEVFFSGVPQKTSRTELLLPPPQAQRRPHGAGLEPAGPRARSDRGAI